MDVQLILQKSRKRLGWSQEKMAEIMNVTQSLISRWERGLVDIRATEFMSWTRKTESQDLVMASMLNVDMAMLADVDVPTLIEGFTDLLTNVVPAFINILGVII